jgi:hypothetical protein
MKQTIQAAPQPNPRKQEIPFPQRDQTTFNQIHNLLTIGGFALSSLLSNTDETFQVGSRPQLDGGCKAAAESVLINVYDRLNGILSDSGRWNLDLNQTLEKKLGAVYDEQLTALIEQSKAAREMSSPHAQFNPTLARLADSGKFVVLLGSLADPKSVIMGMGVTPKEAMASFDESFAGNPSDEVTDFLATLDARLELERQKLMLPKTKKGKK